MNNIERAICVIVVVVTGLFVWHCHGVFKDMDKVAFPSPCQCKMSGGCLVEWTMTNGRDFADGTNQTDYDHWGHYTGVLDVPKECRR